MNSPNTPLTEDQAVEMFKRGEKVILAEYRFGKAEHIKYRDKKTGQPASFTTVRHTVEVGDASFLVSERVPEGFKVEEFHSDIPKGARVLLKFEKFTVQNGIGQWAGVVVPVVTAAKPEKNRPVSPA